MSYDLRHEGRLVARMSDAVRSGDRGSTLIAIAFEIGRL
jgi:hypothetical protein